MPSRTDTILVGDILAGDPEGFEELVRRYYASVSAIVGSRIDDTHVSEEVIQEVFYRAHKSLDTLRTIGQLRAWLCKIATNCAKERLRRAKDRPWGLDESLEVAAIPHMWIWEEVDQLDPQFAEVLSLRYRERLTYRQMAESLGVPVSTINARIYQARSALRRRLIEGDLS